MSGEKPLDEFARGEPESDSGGESEPGDGSQSDSADEPEPDFDADASGAVPTSTWHADGADCDRCGARVDRRWRDGDALVCADCAPW